jgi:hypothetical protein
MLEVTPVYKVPLRLLAKIYTQGCRSIASLFSPGFRPAPE